MVQGVEPQEVVAVSGFDKLLDGAKVAVRAPTNGSGGASGQGQSQGQPRQTGQNNENQPAPSGARSGASGSKNGAPHQ